MYLNELGPIQELPLGVALMVLTTTAESQASADARYLLARVQQEVTEPTVSQAIIEMITTIMVYKFTQLSRREIEQMMGLRLEPRRCGVLSESVKERITSLPLSALEDLSEALLDFTSVADLETWLADRIPRN